MSLTQPHYDWRRFWCPRGGIINLADRGFLVDPEHEQARYYPARVVPLDSLSPFRCLVLLGEPGMGKSVALDAYRQQSGRSAGAAGETILPINLNRFTSDAYLVQSVFQHPRVNAWRQGSGMLHLVLDSVDECLIRIDTLAALLPAELEQLPLDRLKLWIVCRTAVWPEMLEAGLRRLFGENAVGVCELAPLRRKDVSVAAEADGIDAKAFLQEIDRRELAGLAMKPVTLRFLLNNFRRTGSLPTGQVELYQAGCLRLAEEENPSRRVPARADRLSAAQRLAVASRIAGLTVFCRHPVICLGVDDGSLPEGCLPLQALIGGTETADGHPFEVTEAAVRETLDTGLFSARGPEVLGFAHQTYAEFLAAGYLHTNRVTSKQMLGLVTHQADDAGRIVPQLQETAAWLASREPEVFRRLVDQDPQSLLGSDVATMDAESRQRLVAELLQLFDAKQLIDDQQEQRQRYSKLDHPGLSQQLTPYIRDRSKNPVVRRVAIDIAEACGIVALEGLLGDVALDQGDASESRVQAAYALSWIGSSAAKQRLFPCVIGQAGEDPQDELKGVALRSLWPGHLTAQDVFSHLTGQKQRNFCGSYFMFLRHELVPHLSTADLPVALDWLERQQIDDEIDTPFAGLEILILQRAWEALEEPGVLPAFARVVHAHKRGFHPRPGLNRGFGCAGDDQRRRMLAEALIPLHLATGSSPNTLIFSQSPLIFSRDIPWLLDLLVRAETENRQRFIAGLLCAVCNTVAVEHLDPILEARETCPVLRELFAPFVDAVDIHSEVAERSREQHRQLAEMEERHEQRRRRSPPPPGEQVRCCLERCESGDLSAWWRLNMALTLTADSPHGGDEAQGDLRALPGWVAADASTRGRILEAARSYIRGSTPAPEECIGTPTLHRPDYAGYRAFFLLLVEDPQFLDSLSEGVWTRWAPVILAFQGHHGQGGEQLEALLPCGTYHHAPDAILQTLRLRMEVEDQHYQSLPVLRKVEGWADERVTAVVRERARDERLHPGSFGDLLEFLIGHGDEEAVAYATTLVTNPPPTEPQARARALIAARVLLIRAPERGWSVVWPVVQAHETFGRTLMEAVAGLHDQMLSAAFTQQLTEFQVADLYEWLASRFSPDEDRKEESAYFGQPRDDVALFRDAVFAGLQARGTPEAVQAIARLAATLPNQRWLWWSVVNARRNTLQRTWIPPVPAHLLALVRNRDARIVESGEQLLEVVVESLRRLNERLQGETPAAPYLWNEISPKVFRPKDEQSLSNYVALHLREDIKRRGIIVNREVEIRRGEGAAQGERTDIHVDAVSPGSRAAEYDHITVIVEVKGCWNKGLSKDMEEQLRDRYLRDNPCQHGLYIVGWFRCDQWDSKDYREGDTPKRTVQEQQQILDAQAQALSVGDVRIRSLVMNVALR
jgi:hypothetical protein